MTIQEALRTLNVTASSSQAEIKQAYRDQVKVWHPDRFPNDPRLRTKAQEELKKINEAYCVLKDYRPPVRHQGRSEGSPPPQSPRQTDRPASPSPSPSASAPTPPAPEPDAWEHIRAAYVHFITGSARPGFIGTLGVVAAAVMLAAYLRGTASDAHAIHENVTAIGAAVSTQPVPARTPIPGLLFPQIPLVPDVPIQCQIRYRCDVALRQYAIDLKACTTNLGRPHPANLVYSCAKTTASMEKVAAFCEAAVGRYSQAEMSICIPSPKRR